MTSSNAEEWAMRGYDSWAGDQPELQAGLASKRADEAAWHAWNRMSEATRDAREALGNPDLGPVWRDRLCAACVQAGALAVGQEAC